jgi:methyl-accepting chemotaxis protein
MDSLLLGLVERYIHHGAVHGERGRSTPLDAPEFVATLAEVNSLTTRTYALAEEALGLFRTAAEQASSEAMQDAHQSTLVGMIVGGLGIAIGLIGMIVISRAIAPPLHAMTGSMGRLAAGDLTTGVPATNRRDKIGQMAKALQTFKDNAIEAQRFRAEQEELHRQSTEKNAAAMPEMADTFESTVKAKVTGVDDATSRIHNSADAIVQRSQSAGGRSLQVGEAAQRTTERSAVVSEATRQLSASINEIAQQVGHSSEVARKAVEDVNATAQQMTGLSEAVQAIGEVVHLINDIASQTNLLALNATIEAARAGDAGKGFAVVANEVKNLANQTARATDDIARQVATVQESTQRMKDSIGGVVETIRSMGQTTAVIASAVQEQEAVTRDIANNIDDVAREADAVSSAVTDLSRSSVACAGIIRVIWQVEALESEVNDLRTEAVQFLSCVRNMDVENRVELF